MDVPISLGVVLALGISLLETASHAEHAYFDSAVMLLFFLQCGAMSTTPCGARRGRSPWRGPSHSALQILGERFARGEIQKNEYEEKKAAILSGGQH